MYLPLHYMVTITLYNYNALYSLYSYTTFYSYCVMKVTLVQTSTISKRFRLSNFTYKSCIKQYDFQVHRTGIAFHIIAFLTNRLNLGLMTSSKQSVTQQ